MPGEVPEACRMPEIVLYVFPMVSDPVKLAGPPSVNDEQGLRWLNGRPDSWLLKRFDKLIDL